MELLKKSQQNSGKRSMIFNPPLQKATLVKRYKRFMADVTLADGSEITLHCPNTGSMKNCQEPGCAVWFSDSGNPKRKYPCTWQMIEWHDGHRIGINTSIANQLVREAIESGVVNELSGYDRIQAEVRYGEENSRIDFLLSKEAGTKKKIPDCYVEVKNVTLAMGGGLGLFPDAVSARGSKHLRELISMKKQGKRAVIFFCVQHTGIDEVRPADDIDKAYGDTLRLAISAGVEVLAYKAERMNVDEISLTRSIPVVCP